MNSITPRKSVGVNDARELLRGYIEFFLHRRVPAFWRSQQHSRASAAFGIHVIPQAPFVNVAAVPVGLGKSTRVCRAIGEFIAGQMAGPDSAVAYFVPRHRLAGELADTFTEITNLPAATWRGIDADDPDYPGKKMCHQPELSKAASKARVSLDTVCAVCPSQKVCGYHRQREQQAKVWFLPHQSLFSGRPGAVCEPKAIVIDESFWQSGLAGADKPVQLAISTLQAMPDRLRPDDRDFVGEMRQRLCAALAKVGLDGRLFLDMLVQAGVTMEDAQAADRVEWQAKPTFKAKGSIPEIIKALEQHRALFDSRLPLLWKIIENSFRRQAAFVAGLRVVRNVRFQGGEGSGDVLQLQWRREMSTDWAQVPALVLDATARSALIEPYFTAKPHVLEVEVNPPYQRVMQVADCAFSQKMFVGKGGGADRQASRKNNVDRLRGLIEAKAFEHRERSAGDIDVLVVVQKRVEDAILCSKLPARVAVRHFNDIAGEDIYGAVACLIVVGRTLPNIRSVETMAEALTGRPVTEQDVHQDWPVQLWNILAADGSSAVVSQQYHPDETAEAARWTIAQGNIVQALGRARGINRAAGNPVEILLLTDLPVPVPVHKVTSWKEVQVNRFQLAFMLGNRTMPTSDSELARVYGPNGLSDRQLWRSLNAVQMERRKFGNKTVGALLGSLIGAAPSYCAEYRRDGQRGRWSPCLVRSACPLLARAELQAVIGPVTDFRMLGQWPLYVKPTP